MSLNNFFSNNTSTQETQDVFAFYPDTPVLAAPSLTIEISASPFQRVKVDTTGMSLDEINKLKEEEKNYVLLNNFWWVHKLSLPHFAEEMPNVMNISKFNPEDNLYEFVPDTPVLLEGPSWVDIGNDHDTCYGIDPVKERIIDPSHCTQEEIDELKKYQNNYVWMLKTGWLIHKKALPLYIKTFPSAFNIKFYRQ
jgi:hypothetical protein